MESNHIEVGSSELKITQAAKGMEAPLSSVHLSFAEDQNGNDIACLSDPSSNSPKDSGSHGKTNSPHEEMTEDCVSEMSLNTGIIKNMDIQSKFATVKYMKASDNNCNHNVISCLQNGNIESESTVTDDHGVLLKKYDGSSKMCLNTAASQAFFIGPVTSSHSNSSENSSSVSSGEMLIRGNSFIIHESDQPLYASVLEDSSDMPSDDGLMPGLLPDLCKGLVNDMGSASGQNKQADFGLTFIQPSNQTFIMEEDVFQTVLPNGPSESRASLLVAEVNYPKCVTPVNMKKNYIEAERSTCLTTDEGKMFQIVTSEDLDISGNAQTSTPVQSVSSKTFCLSDSPLKNNFGSPLSQVTMEQQSSVSQKPKTSLTASTKSFKSEAKKYIKPDFSNVKSKIMSRPTTSLNVDCGSSNRRQHKNQTRPPHSIQIIASSPGSTSAVSSSSTLACGSHKRDQNNVIKRTPSSVSQDAAPAPKSRPRTWSETSGSLKTKGEDSTVKSLQVGRIINTFTQAKNTTVEGFLSRTSLSKLGDRHASKEEKCNRNPQKASQKVSQILCL